MSEMILNQSPHRPKYHGHVETSDECQLIVINNGNECPRTLRHSRSDCHILSNSIQCCLMWPARIAKHKPCLMTVGAAIHVHLLQMLSFTDHRYEALFKTLKLQRISILDDARSDGRLMAFEFDASHDEEPHHESCRTFTLLSSHRRVALSSRALVALSCALFFDSAFSIGVFVLHQDDSASTSYDRGFGTSALL